MSDESTPTTPDSGDTAAADVSTDPVTLDKDEVTTKLSELGVTDADVVQKIKDLGVTGVEDLSVLTEQDFVAAGVKVVQARKLAGAVKPAPVAAETTIVSTASLEVLPSVPDEGAWLTALKTGGVLKVDTSTAISAIRAALAYRVGLYDIPGKLVVAMEKFADGNDEPVDPTVFFPLRKQLTRKSYADVFEAIDGLDGNYVTDSRKKDLLLRVDEYLWPAVSSFNSQLKAWQEACVQIVGNPAMLMATFAAGSGGMGLPPGMMSPPDTGALRDHADAVKDAINKVFAGSGAQIAAALAYEASQIKVTLENPRLPAMIGAANRDQMLKQLHVGVNATYPRLEVNLTRFVLATMQASDQPAGNEELQYFGAMFALGNQIPWDQLGVSGHGGFSTISGRRSRDDL